MFNRIDYERNAYMLTGPLARKGYDWWWHSFTAHADDTGEELPFFIEFFVCNPALAEKGPTLGQLPANREAGRWPSYVMVKAGCWGEHPRQLHRFLSVRDARISAGAPFSIQVADCSASEFHLHGSVDVSARDAVEHPELMSDAGRMSWDLRLDKRIAYNVGYGASAPLREADAFEMYWHAQGMKTLYAGTVELDGKRYTVDPRTCYGYADKNWGSDFTSPWVWLASSDLVSRVSGRRLENTAFDIGGGRPCVLHVPLPRKLLGGMTYEGRDFEFNFSKFWMQPRTSFDSHETDTHVVWDVVLESTDGALDVHVECAKSGMLWANYEAPDGSKRYDRLWNGGAGYGVVKLYERTRRGLSLVDEMDAGHIGCEYGEFGDSEQAVQTVG